MFINVRLSVGGGGCLFWRAQRTTKHGDIQEVFAVLLWMGYQCTSQQLLYWEFQGTREGKVHQEQTAEAQSRLTKDTLGEAAVAALDRQEWNLSVVLFSLTKTETEITLETKT